MCESIRKSMTVSTHKGLSLVSAVKAVRDKHYTSGGDRKRW